MINIFGTYLDALEAHGRAVFDDRERPSGQAVKDCAVLQNLQALRASVRDSGSELELVDGGDGRTRTRHVYTKTVGTLVRNSNSAGGESESCEGRRESHCWTNETGE